jgi:hypothetical protein
MTRLLRIAVAAFPRVFAARDAPGLANPRGRIVRPRRVVAGRRRPAR